MIKESALDKCFRSRPSRDDHRISPLPPRYECPRPSLSIITSAPETGRTGRRSCSIIPCAIIRARRARLEHSNFFKVKGRPPGPLSEERHRERAGARRGGAPRQTGPSAEAASPRKTAAPASRSNYELFNCSSFNIRYWSWNYRGCWHQACPPMGRRRQGFGLRSFRPRGPTRDPHRYFSSLPPRAGSG